MSQIVDQFLDRPKKQQIGFYVGSLLFVLIVFWLYVYSPSLKALAKLEEQRDTLDTQIAFERRVARNLDKFRKEVGELDGKLSAVLLELPNKKEIPDLLESISNLARDAGLDVSLFKPKGEVMQEFYAEVPVEMSVEGSFHQIASFFDEIGQLPRIVNVNQIALRDPKVTDEHISVKSDCVATTFRYLDEEERKAVKEAAERGKRKRK